jgi:hypothetical protein
MKKILFVLLLTLSASLAFGQFTLGPKIGYTTSKLSTELEDIHSSIKEDFDFGLFMRIGRKVHLQPEIIWTSKGAHLERTENSNLKAINQEFNLKTIDIPLHLGFRLVNFGVGNIRFLFGPNASIVVDKTVSIQEKEEYINPIKTADIEDLIWAVNVGGGIDLFMFTIDVKAQFGINDIVEQADNIDFHAKTNLFIVSLGWKIF